MTTWPNKSPEQTAALSYSFHFSAASRDLSVAASRCLQ